MPTLIKRSQEAKVFVTDYFNVIVKRSKVISYWILVLLIIFAMYSIAIDSAYAEGTVPPSAMNQYPGLDPRLVGVPIEKTDLTSALVAYSQAVDRVNSLNLEKITSQNNISILTPELSRATQGLNDRKAEYNQISTALNDLVIHQYQEKSNTGRSTDQVKPTDLRIAHQSTLVTDSLRSYKEKSKARYDQALKYQTKVAKSIEDAKARINEIDQELVGAKKSAVDSKNVVKTGIPVASIKDMDIPVLTMDAYLRAEKTMAAKRPECGLTWWSLAGIGRAESNHGRYHGAILDSRGTVTPPIIGVALNGNGFAAIGDSDQGMLDGDTQWDRAVGVMQFIPGTWRGYAEDANGDGVIDPQNVYDAALAAAKLLCANARPNMLTPESRRTAFMRYNASSSYVDFVEAKGKFYESLGVGRFNPAPLEQTAPAQ